MSYIPNVGLGTLAGGTAALGAAATGFQAGKAVYNAAQGASTHGKDASFVQQGLNAALGNTADKTQQTVRHLVEAGVWTAPTVGLAASAAATLDAKGEYTFGLGSIGVDLNNVSLPSVFGDDSASGSYIPQFVTDLGSWIMDNPASSVGVAIGGVSLLYAGVKGYQYIKAKHFGG